MARSRGIYVWFAGVFLCTVAVTWLSSTGRVYAAGADAPGGGTPAAAELSGKIALELSSACEAPVMPVIREITLSTSFDGKLRIRFGPGMVCDMTAAVKPHPFTGAVYGYGAAKVSVRSRSGLGLDFSARKGRSSEAEEPGNESAECVLSSLATSLSWAKPGNTFFCKGSYGASEWMYPYRPTRDHEEREVSGLVKASLTPHLSLRADASFTSNEYRLARYNTSTTWLSSVEGSYRWGKGLAAEMRVEEKDMRYPHSPTKTYRQATWEAAASYCLTTRSSLDLFVSRAQKRFPFAPEKDLYDWEIVLSALMETRDVGALTLEGGVFERDAPASSEKAYQISRIEVKHELSPAGTLEVSLGCALSRKRYLDPAAWDGNYHEARVSCRLWRELTQDLEIECEAEVKRREYPSKASNNIHRVKSSVTLVYRI
ncbi:MAG: hypothetical protein AB1700_15025 [Bacillota bacterium]